MSPEEGKLALKNLLETLARMAMEIKKFSIYNMQMEYLLAAALMSRQVHAKILTLPQPNLVFFVDRYLPYLQTSLKSGELDIDLGQAISDSEGGSKQALHIGARCGST